MDLANPHNIMLLQVSEDEYEKALTTYPPVRVSTFGFLAGEPNPPQDDLSRPVFWLYVNIGNNQFRGEYRMCTEDFNNIRVWQFMRIPTPQPNVVQARKKRA